MILNAYDARTGFARRLACSVCGVRANFIFLINVLSLRCIRTVSCCRYLGRRGGSTFRVVQHVVRALQEIIKLSSAHCH